MPKHIFTLLFAFISSNLTGQWTDSFLDADFKSNPSWMGDTNNFKVNPSLQLQLDAPSLTGSSSLFTPSEISSNATWTFSIEMDFNPSSENYAKIFLMSDKIDFNKPLNGYFLRIGYTNDDLCLYRQEGSIQSLIVDGRDKMFNSAIITSRIKVTRNDAGNWSLFCDSTGGINYTLVGNGMDNTILKCSYFGVQCVYTSTRSTKFYFDDFEISGETFTDNTKPLIQHMTIQDDHNLELGFSEMMDSSAINISNYAMEGNVLTSLHYNSTNNTVSMQFQNTILCDRDNFLKIKNIKDASGIALIDTSLIFRYCVPDIYDVVINEIMADPDPPNKLPNAEYLELYNRTSKTFNLLGWQLIVGSNRFVFPEITFSGNDYLIICTKSNESILSGLGKTTALFTSATTLTNNGQFLKLEDANGHVISWVEYSDSWYGDEYKSQGGWSLEQIDPANPCGGMTNWKVSSAGNGGTPGSKNSIYDENPDFTIPEVLHLNLPADTLIDVMFNEPLDTLISTNAAKYNILPGIGHPKNCRNVGSQFSTIQLVLPKPLTPSKTYSLIVTRDISNCAGNQMNGEITLPLAIPSTPDSACLVINEVLFNCKTGGADYVELYNRSGKTLNARQFLIGTKTNGQAHNLCRLSETGFLIFPNSYILVTTNIEKVKAFYHVENENNAAVIPDMPSLDDKSSTIILLNDTIGFIDEFTYSDAMHLNTLKNADGVSLERVNPNKASNFTCNWHSAAATVGFGTPGYQNSEYLNDSISQTNLFLAEEIFSPDNDGFHDMLQITYKFDKPGCRAQAFIFDPSGRLVRHLFTNELLGTEGSFTWDGIDDSARMCKVGMYLVFVRAVFADGTVDEYKKSCVLATKK